MNGRIIFMTEEPSMGATLRNLLASFFPEIEEFTNWLIIDHQGKSDLEKSIPKKLRVWNEPSVRFVILRDNDGGDCRALKKRLQMLIPDGAPLTLIRIVCQELESWFLGDLAAVVQAYPEAGKKQTFKSQRTRDPDEATNAKEILAQLTGTTAKIYRASNISAQMRRDGNRSTSFNVFVSGLERLISADS
jgi:hypothetical protein